MFNDAPGHEGTVEHSSRSDREPVLTGHSWNRAYGQHATHLGRSLAKIQGPKADAQVLHDRRRNPMEVNRRIDVQFGLAARYFARLALRTRSHA
jgi:hypothetical protein